MDIISSVASSTLWLTEIAFLVLQSVLSMVVYVVEVSFELTKFSLSMVPDILTILTSLLSTCSSVIFYVSTEGFALGLSVFELCLKLCFVVWSQVVLVCTFVFGIGWVGVSTLFGAVYGGASLSLSMLYQVGGFLLHIFNEVPWSEKLGNLTEQLSDSVRITSLSDAVSLWITLMLNIFYLCVGLVLLKLLYTFLVTIGPWVLILILSLFGKTNTARQRERAPRQPTLVRPAEPVTPVTRGSIRRRRVQHPSENSDSDSESSDIDLEAVPDRQSPSGKTDSVDSSILHDEVSRLNSELSEERDKNLCVVCLDNKRELLIKPCNHYCLCATCRRSLRSCPVCNKRISSTEKIFHV